MKCKPLIATYKTPICYTKKTKLNFVFGNAKVSKSISTFSLPAGHSCPFAKECLSKSDRITGKIVDGQHCQFRCFAASDECRYPSARMSRWQNFELLLENNSIQAMGDLIHRSLPDGANMIRIHVSGDFFSENYFLAWLNVALNNPMIIFYGYTKALPFLVKYKDYIPKNFRLTASKGGTHDFLITTHNLKFAEVVFSKEEADSKGLKIDHNDSHAFLGIDSFALLIHGTQPVGSKASKAWQIIKKTVGGYSEDKKRDRVETSIRLFVTKQSHTTPYPHLPPKIKSIIKPIKINPSPLIGRI